MNNDHLVLICGESASGKSASLMNLAKPEGVAYLNCESNKKLPFPSKFKELTITDPLRVYDAFDEIETKPDIHTIVIDSQTFLMEMYESTYVLTATNGMQAWSNYAQFWKKLMQHYVAKSTKNVIFIAHTLGVLNETDMVLERKVPVKGALKNNGIESYFSTVVSCKKISLAKLEDYKNPGLIITPEDEVLGIKYCYQTKMTKDTIHERLRSSIGMWQPEETFIDNNAQLLIDRLQLYYK